MNKIKEIFLTLVIFGFSQGCGALMDTSVLSMEHIIRVVDENANPIKGANISITFHHTYMQEQEKGIAFHTKDAVYDGENPGIITSNGADYTIINVASRGYWNSSYSYRWNTEDQVGGEEINKYSRQFTIILRKKENPRPLYVNRIERFKVPDLDKPYGFDLEIGDWVAPNGKGVFADFIFEIKRKSGDEYPAYWSEITWTFSEPDDGFIEVKNSSVPYSKLHLGRVAPLEGYINEYSRVVGIKKKNGVFVKNSHPPLSEIDIIEGCWFRVRSQRDDEGEISGRYGKIVGTIFYSTRGQKKPHVTFTYYLAPNTSRSLEWNGDSLVPGANLQSVNKY